MRARGWWIAALLLCSTSASAEPKPKSVDITPFRGKLLVLADADGGIYVAQPGKDGRLFYSAGKNKAFYEQVVIGRSSDGSTGAWDISTWAPRISKLQPGSVGRKADGSYQKFCGEDTPFVPLAEVTADRAKAILDKGPFMTTAMTRRPHLLARDDRAVYYYVDVIRDQYGGNGHRVFVGKKGAMKQRPLTDVTIDSAGDVFSTKTGDLRIVRDTDENGKSTVAWVKGEKRSPLRSLDLDTSSSLIFKELGIYSFTGSICENL
jgi:hypothetical protein